jgi:hypothetical protein
MGMITVWTRLYPVTCSKRPVHGGDLPARFLHHFLDVRTIGGRGRLQYRDDLIAVGKGARRFYASKLPSSWPRSSSRRLARLSLCLSSCSICLALCLLRLFVRARRSLGLRFNHGEVPSRFPGQSTMMPPLAPGMPPV